MFCQSLVSFVPHSRDAAWWSPSTSGRPWRHLDTRSMYSTPRSLSVTTRWSCAQKWVANPIICLVRFASTPTYKRKWPPRWQTHLQSKPRRCVRAKRRGAGATRHFVRMQSICRLQTCGRSISGLITVSCHDRKISLFTQSLGVCMQEVQVQVHYVHGLAHTACPLHIPAYGMHLAHTACTLACAMRTRGRDSSMCDRAYACESLVRHNVVWASGRCTNGGGHLRIFS